jgi:hypothetical protein
MKWVATIGLTISFYLKTCQACEFKRVFDESHSYVEIKDPNGCYHYMHDPQCLCDNEWISYEIYGITYYFRKIVNEYD